MFCPDCGTEMELRDTTYSNVNTDRAYVRQHTGDIYYCSICDEWWLDDFLTSDLQIWNY